MSQQSVNLAQVYRQYLHLVRAQLRRLTRDEQAVEQLTQEVFLRFWRRHGRGLGGAPQVGEILWRLAGQSVNGATRGRRRPGNGPRWRRFLGRTTPPTLPPAAPAGLPDGCLGNLAMALVGAHERLPNAAELRHLEGCTGCQRRLRGERASVLAAASAPLPPELAALIPPPRPVSTPVGWRAWLSVLAMLGACIGGARVIPQRGPEEPLLMSQGQGRVNVVARRADGRQRLLNLLPDAGTVLQTGEQMRLHLAWPEAVQARLRGLHDGVILFNGRLPADGWLPTSLAGQGTVPPPLELSLCPLNGDGGCWTRTIP